MFIISLLLLFILNNRPILASEVKNIFGIHLTQTSDIHLVKDFVNNPGGDWGWVTIVIRTDQLDRHIWQEFMDNCRKYHLIPIVRLATIIDQNFWKQPSYSDVDNLANFLNTLNWPTKTQYIIPFNEINHGTEWGGEVNIQTFTDIFIYTSEKLKNLNKNFFILSTPLDLAAPEKPPTYKSAQNIYREVYMYNPKYFDSFDGIASHSYPNHGFIGLPHHTGQRSIRGYQWELSYLKTLGIHKTFPIFITETGWPHREGITSQNNYYTSNTAASLLFQSIDIWQKDPAVYAITPFIYNYPHPPFDHFSWLDENEKLYPAYQQIIDKQKHQNRPEQVTDFEVVKNNLPFLIFTDYEYGGSITLKNTGQSIWGETDFCLLPESSPNITIDTLCTPNNYIYPGQNLTLFYKFKINKSDNQQTTFLGWDKIEDKFEITPITAQGQIYHPDLNLKQKILQIFKNFSL